MRSRAGDPDAECRRLGDVSGRRAGQRVQRMASNLTYPRASTRSWLPMCRVTHRGFVPLLRVRRAHVTGVDYALKVAVDFSMSLLLILVSWPLMVLLALGIWLTAGRPIFEVHDALGLGGVHFRTIRFRTGLWGRTNRRLGMFLPREIVENPVLTCRLGRLLYRTGLDKLPQLFDVLSGRMSLVGPRLVPAEREEAMRRLLPNLLATKPGWIGPWAVSGARTVEEEAVFDVYYVRNWTIWLDLQVLFQAARLVLTAEKPKGSKVKALILAAGEGTRLRPLTLTRPKPMVPICDRPLLALTVEQLKSHGITDLAINLHYRPEAITDYFGDGARFGVHITYSHESELLGTAGAAKQLEPFLDETFVVVYGDVLTDLDYGQLLDYHRQRRPLLTLSLYQVDNPTEVGLVALDDCGRIVRFQEKPSPAEVFSDLANSGVLVCEPEILDFISPLVFQDFGHHILPRLLAAGEPVYGFEIAPDEYLIDIGSPEKYARAQREWPALPQRMPSFAWMC